MANTIYRNGTLPTALAHRAYITTDGREFALPYDAALEYLRWCDSHQYEIVGLETWRATSPGPTVIAGAVAEGCADSCRDAMARYVAKFGADIVFNIYSTIPAES